MFHEAVYIATFVRCVGIFINDIIANLLTTLLMKELQKSVSIWQSYEQKYSGAIFSGHTHMCVCRYIPGGPKKRPKLCLTITARILYGAKFPLAYL